MTVRLAAMNLLARREYSMKELVSRLASKFPKEEVLETLEQLKNENLQSDLRYAEMRLRVRSKAGYGPLFIENELMSAGLKTELISSVIRTSDLDWVQLAAAQKQKKEFKDDAHLRRYLYRKGFENSIIQKVIKGE